LAETENVLIFLASPGDVPRERNAVKSVVTELNRSVASSLAVTLRVVTWEHDSYPGYGADAQAIINSQIAEMASYSLFVGVIWNRIGSPTPRALSGTVEEFTLAARAYEQHGRPEIWFYFRNSAARLSTDEELDQRRQVIAFKRQVQQGGLPREYSTPLQFKDLFREHLTLWLGARQPLPVQIPIQVSRREEADRATAVSDNAVTSLLTGLTANCSKARALQIEDELYELLKRDIESYVRNVNQYVAPAREAMAVVGGRILHSGTRDQRIVEILRRLCDDPDLWVRKKARAALSLSHY